MKTTKRIISLILAMLFIGGCFAVGASAEGDMKVTATYDSKNNEVTVNISDIPSGYTVEKTGITVETSSTIIKDPNIKGGDLFVVYFKDCQLNGETLDAIGLFKSENKSQFLKVLHDEEEWSREAEV